MYTHPYRYRIDAESPLRTWTGGAPLPTALGACHALGIMFMFGNHDCNGRLAEFCGSGVVEERLARSLGDSWVRFAASGDPSIATTGAWPPHDPLSRALMVFGGGQDDGGDKDGGGSGGVAVVQFNPRADELRTWGGFQRTAQAAVPRL